MKHIPRFYITAHLEQGLSFCLSNDRINHVFRVLRMKEKEHLQVFNSIDGEWDCEILNEKTGLVQCLKQLKETDITTDGPIIACAIINSNAMSWMLEKITELGAQEIIPLITQYTAHHKNYREDRAKKIIIQACEQCRRISVPKLHSPIKLEKFLREYNYPQELLFGDERLPEGNFYDFIGKNSIFLVGPEGGFSEKEYNLLDKYDFVRKVKISKNILRSETAATAFAAGWNCKFSQKIY